MASRLHFLAHRPPGPPPGGVLPSVRTQFQYAPLQPDPTMNLRSSLRTLALASTYAFITALTPQISAAAVVYNPTDPTGSGGNAAAVLFDVSGNYAAIRFSTTSTDTALTAFSFASSFTGISGSTSVGVQVWSDSSSNPMSSIANAGTVTNVTNSTTTLSLSGLNVNLSASTDYWLVFDFRGFVGGSSAALNRYQYFTLTPTLTGLLTGTGTPFYAKTGTSSFSGSLANVHAFAGTIEVGPGGAPAGVPEPASVSVWGAAAGLMALAHRLRRTARSTA